MRPLFVAASLFFPVAALALKAPTAAEVADLNRDLSVIKAIQGSAQGADAGKWSGILGLQRKIHDETYSIESDAKKLKALNAELSRAQALQADLCQKLIDKTEKAYDVRPPQLSGALVVGDWKNTVVAWKPRFGDMDFSHHGLTRDGSEPAMVVHHAYEAITWSNGDIVVAIDAFRFSPGYLAASLEHETIHFEQDTTPGLGDRLTPVYAERAAYNSELDNADKIFGLTEAEKQTIEQTEEAHMKYLNASPGGRLVGALPDALPDPAATRLWGDSNFAQSLGDLAELSRNVKPLAIGEIAQSRAEADGIDKQQNDQIKAGMAERDARADAAYRYIRAAVRLACSNPDEFRRQASAGKIIAAGLESGEIFSRFASDENEVGWKSLKVKPNECEEYVFDRLLRNDRLTSTAELNSWAEQFRAEHPGLLKRLATSLDEFFSSTDGYQESENDDRSASGSGAAGTQPSSRPPAQGPVRHSPTSWTSLNQLKGLAGQ